MGPGLLMMVLPPPAHEVSRYSGPPGTRSRHHAGYTGAATESTWRLQLLASSRPLSAGEIKAMATTLGGLIRALDQASPTDRAAYRELGLKLTYEPSANQERSEVDLARGAPGCVGGGTCPPAPRQILLDLAV